MKRTLHFLLLTLMMVSALDAATPKKKSKHPTKKATVVEQEPTAQPGAAIPATSIKRERKTAAGDGDPVAAPPGPIAFRAADRARDETGWKQEVRSPLPPSDTDPRNSSGRSGRSRISTPTTVRCVGSQSHPGP